MQVGQGAGKRKPTLAEVLPPLPSPDAHRIAEAPHSRQTHPPQKAPWKGVSAPRQGSETGQLGGPHCTAVLVSGLLGAFHSPGGADKVHTSELGDQRQQTLCLLVTHQTICRAPHGTIVPKAHLGTTDLHTALSPSTLCSGATRHGQPGPESPRCAGHPNICPSARATAVWATSHTTRLSAPGSPRTSAPLEASPKSASTLL